MVSSWRPGMKLYEVTWELESECLSKFVTHAVSEAEAISKAQTFFDQHPEHDFQERAHTTVRARDVQTMRSERPTVEEVEAVARILHQEGVRHGWWGKYKKSYDELAATDPIGKEEFDAIVERMLQEAMRATTIEGS